MPGILIGANKIILNGNEDNPLCDKSVIFKPPHLTSVG